MGLTVLTVPMAVPALPVLQGPLVLTALQDLRVSAVSLVHRVETVLTASRATVVWMALLGPSALRVLKVFQEPTALLGLPDLQDLLDLLDLQGHRVFQEPTVQLGLLDLKVLQELVVPLAILDLSDLRGHRVFQEPMLQALIQLGKMERS
uniref:Uncharacterized protein n=1 Tax=Chrysotila carterae TaxID=13221 RepID=A0A6T0BZC2_CHRCT